MKLTKAIVLPVAAAVLAVAGTGVVLAATGSAAPSGTAAPAAASSSPAPGASSAAAAPYLKSVLDGLVATGTISAAQEQAILDAWVAKRAAWRQERVAERQQLRAFLADGDLTLQELAQLPADSPLQELKPLMANGQISLQELRALGRGIMRELGGAGAAMGNGQGMRWMHAGFPGAAPAPSASPAAGG